MRHLKAIILSVFCSLLFSVAIFSQTTSVDDDEILRIDTQLIDVPIVVTDPAGKPIVNLKPNNFIVYEDGKPQEIANFSATDEPFEVALLLDTSGSTRSDLRLIKRSASMFIDSLREGDRVSIISFNTDVESDSKNVIQIPFSISEVLIEPTDDRAKLKEALQNVGTSQGTPYYDGLLQVAEKIFKEKPAEKFRGRRALVALTDGVDSTSGSGFEEARELLAEAGITTYFIQINTREIFEEELLGDCQTGVRFSKSQIRRYYGLFGNNPKMEKIYDFCKIGDFTRLDISKRLYQLADKEMQNLAKASGGKVFPVASIGGARRAFRKVSEEIGKKYSLGYYSSNENRDGKYRQIKVELKGLPKGTKLRAREGYTAPNN